MISAPALWVAFAAMVPLMIWASWTDLKSLKIRNTAVLAVLGVFIVTGLWGLPTDIFFWRLLHGVIVMFAGFAMFSFGLIGGGDAKMAAALTPFILPTDLPDFFVIYGIITLLLLMLLRMLMQMNRHRETGWLSIDQLKKPARERVFPMGLIFGVTIVIYLGLHTLRSAGLVGS